MGTLFLESRANLGNVSTPPPPIMQIEKHLASFTSNAAGKCFHWAQFAQYPIDCPKTLHCVSYVLPGWAGVGIARDFRFGLTSNKNKLIPHEVTASETNYTNAQPRIFYYDAFYKIESCYGRPRTTFRRGNRIRQ